MTSLYYFFIVLTGVFLITTVILGYFISSLSRRLTQLTLGTNGKNLEHAIYQLMEDHEIFQNRIERAEQATGRLDGEMKSAIRGIATVRYNAFADVGGKQSFAAALISEEGNGVVVSSLYARERMNVYAKPIVNFGSEYELSNEEARALKEACKIYE